MKKLLLFIVLCFMCVPIYAKEKVPVYIFKGDGCPHCEEALEFFDGLESSEKEKFNLIEYEVWNNADNKILMNKVRKKLGDDLTGVPFILVGKHYVHGYNEDYGKQILTWIDTAYENQDLTDIVNKNDSSIVVVVLFLLIVGGLVGFALYSRKKAS